MNKCPEIIKGRVRITLQNELKLKDIFDAISHQLKLKDIKHLCKH
jgi:hypothetical protein